MTGRVVGYDAPAMPDSARDEAIRQHPGFPFLTADVGAVEALMRDAGYLGEGETVAAVEKAGEGNMNLTLRVTLGDGRSVILKQSRPWVEKYEVFAAPFDRAVVEGAFYDVAGGIEGVAEMMPKLLGRDAETRTLLVEDLGAASDLTGWYGKVEATDADLTQVANYARALHDATAGASSSESPALRNLEMRRLNHAHIFEIPLTDHGFFDLNDLEPGLADAAKTLRDDNAYITAVGALGELYLRPDGEVLLHGDLFPGSLLRTGGGLKVIDPEFCFFGPRAFDLGVFVAHLALAGQRFDAATTFLDAYAVGRDESLLSRFAAVEVMRRLIGVAQLPLTIPSRAALLGRSRVAMLAADWRRLWTA